MKLSDLNIFRRLKELEDKEIELEDTLTEVRVAFLKLIDLQVRKADRQLSESKLELDRLNQELSKVELVDLDKNIIDLDVT